MKRAPAPWLRSVMVEALSARGVPEEHAAFVADGLVEASLRAVDTHGVRLFPTYIAELDGGRARARPGLEWQREGKTTRVLDAGGALGMVAGTVAALEAVELARENGVGAVAVANSNHFGPASCYTLRMARLGMIGMCFSNSDALVTPWAAKAALFGTNPLSVAALGEGEEVFCLDMATSQVAYSRIKIFREQDRPLEAGWAVDAEGKDGSREDAGELSALLPLGGYKGQGLGMVVTLLTALLADEPLDHELSHLFAPPYDEPRRVSHLLLALDVGAFV
ncbi:MAG: Ldh family oxidoreductase, partial [Acidobacteria bacterium]|nr:Ldh family oxidoreductase [Acidobacteriota bacterium]